MQHIDPEEIQHNLAARVSYLKKFIDFGQGDIDALRGSLSLVAPILPNIVDTIYKKLLSFDITSKSFAPARYAAIENLPIGPTITTSSPVMLHRKNMLTGWAVRIFQCADDDEFWEYLDYIGKRHAGKIRPTGRRSEQALYIDEIHIGILMGYVADVLIENVMGVASISNEQKRDLIRAANKILWIQHDLFSRHYKSTPVTSIKGLNPAPIPTSGNGHTNGNGNGKVEQGNSPDLDEGIELGHGAGAVGNRGSGVAHGKDLVGLLGMKSKEIPIASQDEIPSLAAAPAPLKRVGFFKTMRWT